MKFSDIVNQALALLQNVERISYRALKREFDLDEEALEDLTYELVKARRVAREEEGAILVWTGEGTLVAAPSTLSSQPSS